MSHGTTHPSVFGVPSRGMARTRTLPQLLAPDRLVTGLGACERLRLTALLAWGRKPSARLAERLSLRRGIPLWRCEDGFLRSLGSGADSPPLSLVLDDLGIYYDATTPSRLEQLICQPLSAAEQARAAALRQLWCRERVSKYNKAPESPAPSEPFVLVVDQTAGDLSISYGLAGPESFRRMLAAAMGDHPEALVVLKIHPEVVAGRRRGHFAAHELHHPRLRICGDGGHPTGLLEKALAVYVVTSQLGFEALLHRVPVHCFGMPFYAGWGLSRDAQAPPERRRGHAPSLHQLIHAALVAYPRWIDPHRLEPCPAETLIAAIGLQRRLREALPAAVEAFGFKPWKQPILRRFLAGPRLRFRRRHSVPTPGSPALAIWGRDPGRGVAHRMAQSHPPALLHLEDGFLRSVGLGANLIDPISWVIDRSGIYYDAGAPSDLEHFLASHPFTAAERGRAARLRQRLVAAAITKYNLPAPPWQRPPAAQRVVLVPGQVENDASIRYGAPGLRTNLALLEAVRLAEPGAWIVYKPHPDVVAGLRQPSHAEAQAPRFCDEVLEGGAIDQLFSQVDALHVLTSLTGFEALLRGVEVHTWGLPFYAGWGLSHDRLSCPRRGRRLDLDELLYGALIAYPRYVSRRSGLFLEPEEALDELVAWRAEAPRPLGWWRLVFRRWGRWRERIRSHTRNLFQG